MRILDKKNKKATSKRKIRINTTYFIVASLLILTRYFPYETLIKEGGERFINQNTEIPNEVRVYLQSLLEDANMTTLDETMREEMIQELYTRLDNFLTGAIVDNLPPEHMEDFIKLNEKKGSQAEIEAFLKEKMPNSQQVFSNAFIQFRDLYLGNVAATRSAPKD